jgi:taurine dioxygenase
MQTQTQTQIQNWQVERLAPALGAEISGADLANAGAAEIERIRELLNEHMVIFFPGQEISVDEHVELGRQFGQLEGHPNLKNPFTQHPEMFELAATQGGVADEWHTDITFRDNPALMSILHMVKCPDTGGDTMWTNLCAAYQGLSEPMREMLDGMTALHDALPHNHPEQMAIHPVVRHHPDTGEKALYVNEHFTRRLVEMNAEESDTLLRFLTRWVQNPRFTVRYRWTEHTIAIWDNRCTQHFVLNDFVGERVIQRVTVMGDQPVGDRARWQPWIREGRLSATSRHDRQLFRYLNERQAQSAD